MPAAEVTAIMTRLGAAGLTAWVDGGWGIDALLGQATREHSDLDLVVLARELPRVREVLASADYSEIIRDWLPAALALAGQHGHQVDLHPVTPVPGGGGDQALPGGRSFRYPPPVTGQINGQPVPCVDDATQVACHLGYPPTAKDRTDMQALHDTLGTPIPSSLRAC
jgi:lincosamide nucleotidyltransferase A/C/D/E